MSAQGLDVGAWLSRLGLERYAQAFRDAEITPEALPELTDADLRELGLPLGPRKVVLKAIRGLAGPSATMASVAEPARAEGGPVVASALPQAERRHLTVLFADLVGSTALSSTLDPEEMREVIRAYQNAVAGEVARFEGHVAKFMGDGVLAYFGWPRAHEDEAERGVRAGLAITRAVAELETPAGSPLAARVGIATGLVVVGDPIGEAEAREQAVVGETPNLAARLQALARPGDVLIAERTRRLVGGLFEVEEWPAVAVKGIPGPVPAYRVLGEGEAEDRFEALRGTNPAPLVGRTHELGLLLDRWERAKDGEGQVVLLAGEPGIGKSRLVSALRERLAHEPHTPLSQFCSPFHQTSALHPVIGLLERAAGFTGDDDPPRKLGKLEALLAEATTGVAGAAPLLAALLSIPTEGRYPPLSLNPAVQKERTFEALLGQMAGLARRRPVLAIYEDVHWADPTSLELLDRVVDRVQALPALVIVTFRPEFVPRWPGRDHVTLLTLGRLARREGATLVERVTGGKALPPEVLEQIVAKTDGVPLFVEELTKAVLESGLLQEAGDRFELAGPLPPLAIPSTLHDSLLARLDRLAPVREVAQIGACIGRVFSHELLAAVASLGDDALRDALAQLCRSELIFRHGTPPEATYTFKHALVQDAAYRSLLRGRRQQLHARIVDILEQSFPDRCEAEPEVLAQHCAQARLAGKAARYWLRAGELAIRRSAMVEAIAQLRKGLELLGSLPDDRERASLELDLQIALGVASMGAKGWAAPEAGRANARALELCNRIGATARLWPVLYGQWVFHAVRAEHATARASGEELLRRAREHQDIPATVVAHRILGSGAFWRGEPVTAREHFERALALYDPEQHRSLAFLYVQDPRVAALSGLAWALFVLGYPDQAWSRSDQALGAARALSHHHTLAYALLFRCLFAQCCRKRRDVREQAGALAALATEQNFPHFFGAATALRGWALSEAGQVGAGLAQLRQGLTAWLASGAKLYEPHFLALQAEAHGRAGRAEEEEGVALLADAVDRARRTGERYFEAELLRLQGELLLSSATPDPTGAEQCLVEALATARRQRARMWELRAATSLARLWRDRGRRREARDLLAPAYGWFTEGAGTPDLERAKALVDELG